MQPLSGCKSTLYTLINRDEVYADGPQLLIPHGPDQVYYDLWNGQKLFPEIIDDKARLVFRVEGDDCGAVLVTNDNPAAVIHTQGQAPGSPPKALRQIDSEWRPLLQKPLPPAPTGGRIEGSVRNTGGMIHIPAAEYLFTVSGMMIEGRNARGVGVEYSWEKEPRRHHRQMVPIGEFWFDRTPVTNQAFQIFLGESSYRPADDAHFLKHWIKGSCPPGAENQPVGWVSLEDAWAYAHWYGKRLPHEWEWQYAAQGQDGRLYPWGNEDRANYHPEICSDPHQLAPADVDAHPQGASPFGAVDLVGNVWQLTDAYEDDRTRYAVLRGGSRYYPTGSGWYFPNTVRLDYHGKYLLMAPGLDRSGMIGFRCARDGDPA